MQSYLILDWPRMGRQVIKAMSPLGSWVPMDMQLRSIWPLVWLNFGFKGFMQPKINTLHAFRIGSDEKGGFSQFCFFHLLARRISYYSCTYVYRLTSTISCLCVFTYAFPAAIICDYRVRSTSSLLSATTTSEFCFRYFLLYSEFDRGCHLWEKSKLKTLRGSLLY